MFSLLTLVQPFIMNIKTSADKRQRNSRLRLILVRHKMSAREISARLPKFTTYFEKSILFLRANRACLRAYFTVQVCTFLMIY